MIKKLVLIPTMLISAYIVGSCGQTSAKCPSDAQIKEKVKDFIPQDFTVESVTNLKDIAGLCEVVVKVGAQPIVFYMDKEGKYLLAGNLISIGDKKNLTRERQQEFMKVSQDILKELEKHVNLKFGEGQKYIYKITDPDCPFCKRSQPIIEEWAKKNNVEVRYILFPLPIHPEAFPKSVAMICGKGKVEELYGDLSKDFISQNQCEEGKKAIEENLKLAEKLGIGGTPTFIGMNGKIHSGVPTEEDLDALIK